jgi:hypothetical protein
MRRDADNRCNVCHTIGLGTFVTKGRTSPSSIVMLFPEGFTKERQVAFLPLQPEWHRVVQGTELGHKMETLASGMPASRSL